MGDDPFRAFGFRLEIGGEAVAGFSECSGIGARIERIAFREGGSGEASRHRPGQLDLQPVTLGRGVGSAALGRWLTRSLDAPERREASLFLLEADGTEAARWALSGAWPSGWRAGAPEGGAFALESLTLVCDEIVRRDQA